MKIATKLEYRILFKTKSTIMGWKDQKGETTDKEHNVQCEGTRDMVAISNCISSTTTVEIYAIDIT